MVKFSFDFCPVADELRAALDERRMDDAKRIAIKHLRAGYKSQQFWDAVADLLEIKKEIGVVGRKQLKSPVKWFEIGNVFQDLRDAGVTRKKAYEKLANDFGQSIHTIRDTVRFFEKADEAAHK